MSTIDDPRITESSGLAYSQLFGPDVVYTIDDARSGIFCLKPSTGDVIGTFWFDGITMVNAEAIDVDINGIMRVWDGGNNGLTRSTLQVYELPEPGPGYHGAIPVDEFRKINIKYPDNKKYDCEAMYTNRTATEIFWITKGSPKGKQFKTDLPLPSSTVTLEDTGRVMPELVTDAALVNSGDFLGIRMKGKKDKVTILKPNGLYVRELAATPAMVQPESITVEQPGGGAFWIGSEGANSPLRRLVIPEENR